MLTATAVVAVAGHQATGIPQYTGCLVKTGAAAGTLVKFKVGTAPKAPCAANEQLAHLSAGDITAIVTGASGGLAGGRANGSVQLALRRGFKLPQGCPAGRVAKWNGSVWVCALDVNTTYSAGDGLALDGTAFDVTGAPWTGLTGVPAGFADDRDDTPGLPTFSRTAIDDSDTFVGPEDSAIAIGTDGYGLIAYFDAESYTSNVAHCTNTACTAFDPPTIVDTEGFVGAHPSITIGADGFGLISHYDTGDDKLRVVHCTNTPCTTFDPPTTVDSTGGQYTSITTGTDGFGLISYYDAMNDDLKVVHCTNAACSTSTTPTAAVTAGLDGQFTSIAIGVDGFGVISHYDASNGNLNVSHCSNTNCTAFTATTALDTTGDVGRHTSMALGTDGLPVISYYDLTGFNLKVARCNNTTCTGGATLATPDSGGNVGRDTSITIGEDGFPLVSYYDVTNTNLKVAHCTTAACATSSVATVDSSQSVGAETSITIGTDGFALISYIDASAAALAVAHCSDPFCLPNVRRR